MKMIPRYLIFAALMAALCTAGQSQPVRFWQDAQKVLPGAEADQEKLQAPSQVSDAQKKEFIRMLDTLPHEGEFYSEAAIDKAGPYLPVLLALTEKDLEKRDVYPFVVLSRGLCDRKEHRAYALRHFEEIQHPLLQLAWGAMLFDAGASPPVLVRFLRRALDSPTQSNILSHIVGPRFEQFKNRVVEQAALLGA